MADKPLFEGIKCITRRYTMLSLFILAGLINILFFLIRLVSSSYGMEASLGHDYLVLLAVTIVAMTIVTGFFLYGLDAIRDKMVVNLQKLITIIRNQSPQNFHKKIELEQVSCDDEVYEIVTVLNERSEQIQQYIQHLKYVIGYIQHEFNTPLATLSLGIERLQKKNPSIDITPLQEEIDHLSTIMNSLSYLSSKDKKNLHLEEVSVGKATEKAVNQLQASYPNIDLHYHGDDEMVVNAHAIYMHIILKNIIENALKYSCEEKKIDVTFDTHENIMLITDYGIGMSEQELKKIGLPFRQADTSRSQDHGFGLGLTLVYELAELLDITISVVSQKHTGTTFTLGFNKDNA